MTYTINRQIGKIFWLTAFFSFLLLSAATAQIGPTAMLGEWQSAKKDSRIIISEQGEVYFGKIVWGTG